MNYKFLFLLFIPLFFAACDDDDGGSDDTILVRLENVGTVDVPDLDFGFFEGDVSLAYGNVAAGETTGYLNFEEGSTCYFTLQQDCDFSATCLAYNPRCRCICPVSPGRYTIRFEATLLGNGLTGEFITD